MRKDGEVSDYRIISVNGEWKVISKIFEDILLGFFFMRYIKVRIGKKLYEVEEEMVVYRSGYNIFDKK